MNMCSFYGTVAFVFCLMLFLGHKAYVCVARRLHPNYHKGEMVYYIIIDRVHNVNRLSDSGQTEYIHLLLSSNGWTDKFISEPVDDFDLNDMRKLCVTIYLEIMNICDPGRKIITIENTITEESIINYVKKAKKKDKNYKVCLLKHELINFAIKYLVDNKDLKMKEVIDTYIHLKHTKLVGEAVKEVEKFNNLRGYGKLGHLPHKVIKYYNDELLFSHTDHKHLKNSLNDYNLVVVLFTYTTPHVILHSVAKDINITNFDPAAVMIKIIQNTMRIKKNEVVYMQEWFGPLGRIYTKRDMDDALEIVKHVLIRKLGPYAGELVHRRFMTINNDLCDCMDIFQKYCIFLSFIHNKAAELQNAKCYNDLIEKLANHKLNRDEKKGIKVAINKYKEEQTKSRNFLDNFEDFTMEKHSLRQEHVLSPKSKNFKETSYLFSVSDSTYLQIVKEFRHSIL